MAGPMRNRRLARRSRNFVTVSVRSSPRCTTRTVSLGCDVVGVVNENRMVRFSGSPARAEYLAPSIVSSFGTR